MAYKVSRRDFAVGLPAATLVSALAPSAQARVATTKGFLAQPRGSKALDIISPDRLADQSKAILPPGAWEYIHGSAGAEWTVHANRLALDALSLRAHRLAGFEKADTSSNLFGTNLTAPYFVCPMGAQDFAHVDAELASVRGAGTAGVPYILSSASNKSLEEVAAAAPADLFRMFAIYLNTDQSVNIALARRARLAGYRALVMTVDSLGPGNSDRYLAMGSPKTAVAGFGNFDPKRGGVGTFTNLKKDFAPEDVAMLKRIGNLPVLVKGILRADDAERAVAAGAAGIIVSNHGGRTLDGAIAAIDALPFIVRAVGGKVPVLFDSGVRRGTDAIRALALGASAAGIGRPLLDAMSLGGAEGVASLLQWFMKDLSTQMLQIGAAKLSDLTPDLVTRVPYGDGGPSSH